MARTRTLAVYRLEHRTIVGRPDQVAAALRRAAEDGRLCTDPAAIADSVVRYPDGRVACRAALLVPRPPTAPVGAPIGRAVAITVAAVVLVFAAFYALGRLLVALFGPLAVSAVVVAVGLLAWAVLSTRRPACRGLHCAGCPRHR